MNVSLMAIIVGGLVFVIGLTLAVRMHWTFIVPTLAGLIVCIMGISGSVG